MRAANNRAPGAGGTGGRSDRTSTQSDPILRVNHEMSDDSYELELLGAMLRCQTPADVRDIMFTVPAEAFGDPLNAAIWRAAEALVDNGVSDPVGVVQTVVAAGLWPRDLHHEVTARVVDAITDSRFDPHDWNTPAVEVLYSHGRRTAAAKLAQVARILPSARLHKVAADLLEVAEFVETVAYWIDHTESVEVEAA